jgi:hypothetical protein
MDIIKIKCDIFEGMEKWINVIKLLDNLLILNDINLDILVSTHSYVYFLGDYIDKNIVNYHFKNWYNKHYINKSDKILIAEANFISEETLLNDLLEQSPIGNLKMKILVCGTGYILEDNINKLLLTNFLKVLKLVNIDYNGEFVCIAPISEIPNYNNIPNRVINQIKFKSELYNINLKDINDSKGPQQFIKIY